MKSDTFYQILADTDRLLDLVGVARARNWGDGRYLLALVRFLRTGNMSAVAREMEISREMARKMVVAASKWMDGLETMLDTDVRNVRLTDFPPNIMSRKLATVLTRWGCTTLGDATRRKSLPDDVPGCGEALLAEYAALTDKLRGGKTRLS